jgi:membrane fusion protein (multidrug efflux system)
MMPTDVAAPPGKHPAEPASPELPAKRPFWRNHRKLAWGLGLGLPILVVLGLLAWWYTSGYESTDDAQIEGHITPISARVGGRVIFAMLEENTFVKAGTVLVRLDPRDYEVALQRAEADLAVAEADQRAARTSVPITTTNTESQLAAAQAAENEAQAGVDVAVRDVENARAALRQAEAELLQARANFEKTSRDLERYTTLVAKDEIPRQQYDAAVAQNEAAKAAVQNGEAGVQRAQESIRAAESRVNQAQARVVQARAGVTGARSGPQQIQVTRAQAGSAEATVQFRRAAVEQAKLNLQYTVISATVDGILGRRSVEVGQNIQPGQPLYSLVDLQNLWVTANFKETQLAEIRVGQRVSVSVDAYDGKDYRGRVESNGSATGATFSMLPAENATGNYVKVVQRLPVRIRLDPDQDPEHRLRPGMSVVPTVYVR